MAAYGDIGELSPSQQKIIRQIIAGARKHPKVGKYTPRERRKAINTGLAVGYTEARYSNPKGGDRDSGGWRQERRMYYDDVNSVPAAVHRFFDEYDADADKSAPLGVRAQQVQQSGTPNVWDDLAPMADRIRREFGGSAGGGGGKGGGSARQSTFKVPIPGEMQVDEAGFEQALREQKVATMLANDGGASSFLSDLTLGGAKAPDLDLGLGSGAGEDSVLFRSGLLSTAPVDPAAFRKVGPERAIAVKTPGAAKGGNGKRASRGRGGASSAELAKLKIRKDGNKGAKQVAEWATRGIYGSGERTPEQNAAVGGAEGSDHLTTKTDASAVDAKYGSGRLIAKRLGLGKKWKPGTYDRHIIRVDGRTYSVQILEDVEGHYDHAHLGVQRV